MKNDELDKKINAHVSKQLSDQEVDEMKRKIEDSLGTRLRQPRRKKHLKTVTIGLAIAAALFIGFILFSTNTDPKEVVMQSDREVFLEKKQEVIEIEEQEEKVDVGLEHNQALNYIIYIDESRYKMVKGESVDRIEMLEPVEGFPEVYMEISREENTTTAAVLDAIRAEIEADESLGIRREESVTEPIDAEVIQGMGLDGTGDPESFGVDARTPIHRYYVTEAVDNQVFIVKQVYFLEAAEGHGARFHYMLDSFEIVE